MALGKLIIFEGIDGSGKGMALKQFLEIMDSKNMSYVTCPAIGAGRFGNKLRNLIVSDLGERPSAVAESLIFLSAIQDVVENIIAPNIADGTHVILDRYFYSTYVYQSALAETTTKPPGLSLDKLLSCIGDLPKPDYLFYMDILADNAIANIKSRGDVITNMDTAVMRNTQRYIDLYKSSRELYPAKNEIILNSNPPYPKTYEDLNKVACILENS